MDAPLLAILRRIETRALALRDTPPAGVIAVLDDTSAAIDLPMERTLYQPARPPVPANVVDKTRLTARVRQALHEHTQVSLQALCDAHPLDFGLAELLAYLQLASDTFHCVVDDAVMESVTWQVNDAAGQRVRRAHLPRIVFIRHGS
ncbi:DUF3375 family protein [Cupriavidus campinensis]